MSLFNVVICTLITLAVFLAIVETEPTVRNAAPAFFFWAEAVLFAIFLVEYSLRVYVAPLNPRNAGRWPRLNYLRSGWSIIDLAALLSFVLTIGPMSLFYMRLIRVLRILRLSRLGRFSAAWESLWMAVRKRKHELLMSGLIAFVLMIFSSALLYAFESSGQPEAFGSIPRALWWSVATLTTVGYGDVTPITPWGQFFAGLTAITGIGIVAMPTGILAAAFSDAFQNLTDKDRE